MTSSIKCITYNVKGIGDAKKRKEIFHYLHCNKWDIIFLQEVHSQSKNTNFWNTQWGSKIYYAHGESNVRGVATLFNRKLEVKVHNVISSDSGSRYVIIFCTIRKAKWLLVNIYAPNKDDPEFFAEMFKQIGKFSPDYLIMADLNLAIDTKDW